MDELGQVSEGALGSLTEGSESLTCVDASVSARWRNKYKNFAEPSKAQEVSTTVHQFSKVMRSWRSKSANSREPSKAPV